MPQAFTAQQFPFAISPPLRVTQVLVSSAPFVGGSRVTIVGDNFADTASLTCRFGPHAFVPRQVLSLLALLVQKYKN
jgi:hypothetical protein